MGVGGGARLQMAGALEEHVTSYDKRAHWHVTAIDTRLSNDSIIGKNEEKKLPNVLSLFILQYLLTGITYMWIAS